MITAERTTLDPAVGSRWRLKGGRTVCEYQGVGTTVGDGRERYALRQPNGRFLFVPSAGFREGWELAVED